MHRAVDDHVAASAHHAPREQAAGLHRPSLESSPRAGGGASDYVAARVRRSTGRRTAAASFRTGLIFPAVLTAIGNGAIAALPGLGEVRARIEAGSPGWLIADEPLPPAVYAGRMEVMA